MKTDLTADRARELLDYDEDTGVLTRRVSLTNSTTAGNVAGYKHPSKDYIYLYVDGKRYFAHRVIWLLKTGKWPSSQIDHIDRDRTNNKWMNLREANNSENGHNKSPTKRNTSGLTGVSWQASAGKWKSQISIEGSVKYLGLFKTKEEAHGAYLKAKADNQCCAPLNAS